MMKRILSTEGTVSKIVNNISSRETTILDSLVIDSWLDKAHASFISISPFFLQIPVAKAQIGNEFNKN